MANAAAYIPTIEVLITEKTKNSATYVLSRSVNQEFTFKAHNKGDYYILGKLKEGVHYRITQEIGYKGLTKWMTATPITNPLTPQKPVNNSVTQEEASGFTLSQTHAQWLASYVKSRKRLTIERTEKAFNTVHEINTDVVARFHKALAAATGDNFVELYKAKEFTVLNNLIHDINSNPGKTESQQEILELASRVKIPQQN